VSCPNAKDCWATGSAGVKGIYVTTNGGSSWKEQTSGVGRLLEVSCRSTKDCWAMGIGSPSGTDVVATSNGKTWRVIHTFKSLWLPGITCASTTACVVVGTTTAPAYEIPPPVVVRTTSGGKTWTEQTF